MNSTSSNRMGASALAIATATLGLAACVSMPPKPSGPVENGQNWTRGERAAWYTGSQGSRLIPKAWLLALEAPNSTGLFMAAENFDRFGYLRDSRWGEMPIGFAPDDQSDEKLRHTRLRWFADQGDRETWIGLNCAACHTNVITYTDEATGKAIEPIWVDGAPTLADFQAFTDSLLDALQQTYKDPERLRRFARRLATNRGEDPVGPSAAADEARVRQALQQHLVHQEDVAAYNVTNARYGPGRLDAVGHILNKVAFVNVDGIRNYRGEPNAPVSYPFIWNANQHDYLQWNGIVPSLTPLGKRNVNVGALVRNISEVTGVFAEVHAREGAKGKGYRSSVDTHNLTAMEFQLSRLMSPAWPASFPAIDTGKAARGSDLFTQDCVGCHARLERDELKDRITAVMTPVLTARGVGTDPWMMCNAYTYWAKAGLLHDTRDGILFGKPVPDEGPTADYIQPQAVGIMLRNKARLVWIAILAAFGRQPKIERREEAEAFDPSVKFPLEQPKTPEQRLADCERDTAKPPSDRAKRILAYKGRPLNGIWATAPYLHNGSVWSLDDLLKPPAQRAPTFWVGNREFDPVHVGFKNEKGRFGWLLDTRSRANEVVDGNSNSGHDYKHRDAATGVMRDYTDDERSELVEYMKRL